MATGDSTWEGLGLPRLGEYQQEQQTAANDMVTLTGASSQSGDFLVCENSSGTEKFVVESNARVNLSYVNFGRITAGPTTSVDMGDLFILSTGTTQRLGIVTTGTTKLYTAKFQYTAGSSS